MITINDWQKRRFVDQMIKCMFNTLAGKCIAIFGFAFKKNTGDVRAPRTPCTRPAAAGR